MGLDMRFTILTLLIILGWAPYCAGQQDSIAPKGSTQPDTTAIKSLPTRTVQVAGAIPAPKAITLLDSLYSSVPLFFKDGDQYYFYVVNGNWVPYDEPNPAPKYLMGIVDENNDTILPPDYHKLYTPNGTAEGYIEIEKDGKRGLVNYHTKQLIPATFDGIYPSGADGVVATGKRGNQYFNLLANGSEQLITDKAQYPSYLSLLKNLVFDLNDYYPLCEVYAFGQTPSKQVAYFYRTGIIAPPSYLIETGFVKEWVRNVAIEGGYSLTMLKESRSTIAQSKTTQWGFSVFIADLYNYGMGTRNYFADQRKVVATIDSNNNVINTAEALNIWVAGGDKSHIFPPKPSQFIGDSLIEIPYVSYLFDSPNEAQPYDGMSSYKYVAIKRSGNIEPLENNRIFPFTKYIYITETYFKGSYLYVREERDEEMIKWPDNDDIWYYIADHLTANDLDLMYNEILADYGYKFKDAKWDAYFRQQPWYTPRFDNVDNQLKPWEIANLKLIKAMRDKIAKNPQNYIHVRFEEYKYR